MLLGKRGDINEVFTYKNNFPEEKNIFASGKKTDRINTEKNYTAVLGVALALSAFMESRNRGK